MIEVAERKAKQVEGCRFRVGSATAIPFEAGSFDLCVGDAFLHHILDIQECLREVHRVLKPKWIATFNEPNAAGYALLEFVLRTVSLTGGWKDPSLDDYLDFLRVTREHEGDLVALAAYPLPDKHVFTPERIRTAASKVGFESISWAPAMGLSPMLWENAFEFILDAVKPQADARRCLQQAARLLDVTLGDLSRQQFCLHNQFYLYK